MYEQEKRLLAEAALKHVKNGMVLGLGTGSTTRLFIEVLGNWVQDGGQIQGVATSDATAEQAKQLNIPLLSLEEATHIDLVIDGIDQIDRQFQVLKGGGGALFREKVVALMSREVLYLADASKFVHHLSGPLPVEVEPFAGPYVEQRLQEKHLVFTLRQQDGQLFVTDGGHLIIDVDLERIQDVRHFAQELKGWSGVVETGYFERQPDHVLTVEQGNVRQLAHPNLRDGGGLV
ncbi:ribose-5-phosphate isomerase RpiA [Exiguobacterium antarcticum]|uniref:Ribose-5-phosphate isomerase A n=1 Tax=Exiguobacterium antarcticum TaxID=132920 RepID=A0ABT6R027_9BACL|nr:ribose-5-phosphate isomerase RpiA [Exiguobacterium antarcticum]AFS70265.1 Ribose-5-phosphate isomerase A [Exiguobacterium antarcticum B7]MDI3234305.1 ribose-5-phosphate isomerase RpiA [Exiguobacterium antarcticum]